MRTFNPKELSKFEDMVISPYFNKNKNVIKLFSVIKPYAPGFENENLEKEKVWKILFPGKEYNYGIMKNLIHDLNKIAINFLELENYSSKKADAGINLVEQYLARDLYNLLEKKFRDVKEEFDKSDVDTDYYYRNLSLENIRLTYLILKHNLKDINKFDFEVLNRNNSSYFYSKYFQLNYNALQISFLYNLPYDKEYADKMLKSYEDCKFKDRYTDMMYLCFKTVYDPFNEDNYYRLKEFFYDNFDKLTKANKYLCALALLNYCKNNSNSGNLFFINERYQYNKIIAENELFLHSNPPGLGRHMFMSIVMAATTANEFDWAEYFIEKYKSYLDEEYREHSVNFAYTNLHFKKKNFSKALEYLSKCNIASGMDKINIKTYQFFLYYELGYFEEIINLADTSRHFSKNDKTISKHSQTEFINFVNIVKRLSEYKYNRENGKKDDFALEEIKKYISENTSSGKKWFKEKISELEAAC